MRASLECCAHNEKVPIRDETTTGMGRNVLLPVHDGLPYNAQRTPFREKESFSRKGLP